MIDNPKNKFTIESLPEKKVSEIVESVVKLNTIAQQIRQRRFSNGALRFDSPKLIFRFDGNSNFPCGVSIDEVYFNVCIFKKWKKI